MISSPLDVTNPIKNGRKFAFIVFFFKISNFLLIVEKLWLHPRDKKTTVTQRDVTGSCDDRKISQNLLHISFHSF